MDAKMWAMGQLYFPEFEMRIDPGKGEEKQENFRINYF